MPRPEAWERRDIESLMAIASAMTNLTAAPHLVTKIPAFLTSTLNIGPCALGCVVMGGAAPELHHVAHSNPQHVEAARQDMSAILQTLDLKNPADKAAPGRASFYRAMDASHGALLVVYAANPLAEKQFDTLTLVADSLGQLLGAMLMANNDPAVLGTPFDRLTDREWVVLRGLQSDEGEKQLADKLELSPHTLHSHIKSIYRKLGVQGRLPVLMLVEDAQRSLKMKHAAAAITKVGVG